MEENEIRTTWGRVKSGVITVGAILTMFALFFGGFQFIDNTYARDYQVQFLGHKIDVKILDDRINKLQIREWSLTDRLAILKPDDPDRRVIIKQIRESEAERKRLDTELQIVIQKYKASEDEMK